MIPDLMHCLKEKKGVSQHIHTYIPTCRYTHVATFKWKGEKVPNNLGTLDIQEKKVSFFLTYTYHSTFPSSNLINFLQSTSGSYHFTTYNNILISNYQAPIKTVSV